MSRACVICGRTSSVGNTITRSGSPKYKGGIGLHTGGITKRRFYPNIQKIKIVLDGKVKKLGVCTRCIKAGKVQRAPARPNQIKRSADKAEVRRQGLLAAQAAQAAVAAQVEKETRETEAAEAAATAATEADYEARAEGRGRGRGRPEGKAETEGKAKEAPAEEPKKEEKKEEKKE